MSKRLFKTIAFIITIVIFPHYLKPSEICFEDNCNYKLIHIGTFSYCAIGLHWSNDGLKHIQNYFILVKKENIDRILKYKSYIYNKLDDYYYWECHPGGFEIIFRKIMADIEKKVGKDVIVGVFKDDIWIPYKNKIPEKTDFFTKIFDGDPKEKKK